MKRLTTRRVLVEKNNGGTKATFNQRANHHSDPLQGLEIQALLKDRLPRADNIPEQPNSSHYFVTLHTTTHIPPLPASP